MNENTERKLTGAEPEGCCGSGCDTCPGKGNDGSCDRGNCPREAGGECPKEAHEGRCVSGGCCGSGCAPRSNLHAFNYFEDIPGGYGDDNMVEVHFKNTRKGFYVNSTNLPLEVGDLVAVEASPGHDIGRVALLGPLVRLQMRKAGIKPDAERLRVFRKAKPNDIERYEKARALENDTMIKARKIAVDLNLNMKIGDVEYQGDGNKAIFYYIADERVDFRQLIKVLAETFKVRIEMKQIGARQEAGRIGGIGPCGRPLCCSGWMTNFVSVSTGAARYQDISLNPQKLAGQCAKLKCCLNFEVDSYVEASRKLPPKDVRLETADSTYFYFKADILKEEILYSTDKHIPANLVNLTAREAWDIIELNKQGIKPEALKEKAEDTTRSAYADVLGQDQESLTRFDKKKKKKRSGQKGGSKNQGDRQQQKAVSEEGKSPEQGRQQGKARPQGHPDSNNQKQQPQKEQRNGDRRDKRRRGNQGGNNKPAGNGEPPKPADNSHE